MKKKTMILGAFALAFLSACSSLTSNGSSSKYQYLLTAIQKYNDIDTDSNGKLSKTEISNVTSSLNLSSLLTNFTTVDTNDDSELSMGELVKYKSLLGL